MDAFDVLIKQFDERTQQLADYLQAGNLASFEEYKKLCGEIRGLLFARDCVLDLKQRMEYSDE